MRWMARTALAVVSSVGLIGLLAVPGGAAPAVQRLGYCGGDDWEPTVATAPGGYVYVLITHYSGATDCAGANGDDNARIMIQVSSDGGSTFSTPQVVSNDPGGIAYPSQADPAIAVDSSTGDVYVSLLAYGLSGGHTDIYVARSTDHGATFPQVVKANNKNFHGITGCKNCDHEKILASNDDVYLAYSQAQYHYISVSTDAGASFTQRAVDSTYVVAFAEAGVLDASGNAWFAWGDCKTSNCTSSPAVVYRVSETLAGTGQTTFSPVIGSSLQSPDCPFSSCGFAFFGGQDGLAIDGGGRLYLDWQTGQQDVKKSPPIIELSACSRRCLAGGWHFVSRVDDKTASNCPNSACYALFPNLVGGPGAGQVSATWMDDRNDSLDGTVDHVDGWNLWYRTSTNGGASWTTPGQQISTFDPSQSQETAHGFLFPYGDYTGIALNPNCPTDAPVVTWGEGHDWVGGPSAPGHIEFASLC
jgi:hypothetical protein